MECAEVFCSLILELDRLCLIGRNLYIIFVAILAALVATILSTLVATILSTLVVTILAALVAAILSALVATILSALVVAILAALVVAILAAVLAVAGLFGRIFLTVLLFNATILFTRSENHSHCRQYQ